MVAFILRRLLSNFGITCRYIPYAVTGGTVLNGAFFTLVLLGDVFDAETGFTIGAAQETTRSVRSVLRMRGVITDASVFRWRDGGLLFLMKHL